MIYGQQSGRQAGSVWSIAMTAAMGNGIGPRSIDEAPQPSATTPATKRWPWSRAHEVGEAKEVAPQA